MSNTLLMFFVVCCALLGVMNCLNITSWNMRGWGSSKYYLTQLLPDTDVMCIQEHMLYECESHRIQSYCKGFSSVVKCSKRLNNMNCGRRIGQGGVAILYKTSIRATEICCDSDRICGVKIMTDSGPLHILCVYLPQAGCITVDFSTVLQNLNDVVNDCLMLGRVVVIGDVNANVGTEDGARGWGTTSQNGKLLNAFSRQNNMVYVDLLPNTTGPSYTYMSHWGTVSCLDHCLVTKDLQESIMMCKVHEEQIENNSDHLPISITLQISCHNKTMQSCKGPVKIAWDRATNIEIKEKYTTCLDNIVKQNPVLQNTHHLVQSGEDMTKIDVCIETITQAMIKASKHLPTRQYRKHLKPYWSLELSVSSKYEKSVRAKWIAAGKPREQENELRKQYQQAKRVFQRKRRKAQNQYNIQQHQEIIDQGGISQKYFWFLVNKIRKPKNNNNINPIKFPNGVTASEQECLAEQWKIYFEDLSTPASIPSFCADHKQVVEDRLRVMEGTTQANDNTFLGETLTLQEIETAIKSLKKGKAGGHDGLVSENIIYASPYIHEIICSIMNSIIIREYIPESFRCGICIPLHKGGNKAKNNPDNYRKITLLPMLSKLFETLLLNRADKWLTADSRLGELQGAAQEGASCLHTSLLLRETIHHRVEQDGLVHIALLDAKKAFDSVWVDGLFVKLYEMGLNAKLWRILRVWYKDLRCKVRVGDHLSQPFQVLVGVFQGGKWSSRLFQAFYMELIKMLCETLKGCNIYDLRAVCPTYADDVAVIAPYTLTLQYLVSVVELFANKWRLQFNPSKCICMIFSKQNISQPKSSIILNGRYIESTAYTKHLGAGLGDENLIIHEMIQKGRSVFYGLLCLGSKIGGINPVTATKIYWSTVIPSMMYGIEVLCLSDNAMEILEQQHRNFGKRIQCLPETTSNPAAYSLLGWKSLQAFTDLSILTFFYKILTMKSTCIYKKLILRIIVDIRMSGSNRYGPTAYFVKLCAKYDLLQHIWDVIDSGTTMLLSQWKTMCKLAVDKMEQDIQNIKCLMFEKLVHIRNTPITVHPWWQVSEVFPKSLAACRLMVKFLVGEEPLNINIGRFVKPKSTQNQLCNVCTSGCMEDNKHFLFVCESLAKSRQVFETLLMEIGLDGTNVFRSRNVQAVLRADIGLEVTTREDYLYTLSTIAQCIYSMFLQRQNILHKK
jgi:exonuclease III